MPARYEYVNGNIKYKHEYDYTTGALPATPKKTIEYHYDDSSWSDVLTSVSEITYSTTNSSTASTYSLNNTVNQSTASDTLAKSLLGNNCKKVDITANGVLNVGDDDLATSNMNTYSMNSTTNSSTLFSMEVDEIGNMTKFNGYDFNWNGRRLESISQDGVELISYKYNIDGQRVSKTVGNTTTEYFYNGDILAGQKTGNDVLIFMYDNNGDVFGFTYNGTPYYYIKNAQNDVYMIVDETGVAYVLYMYDAWGRVACYDGTDFGLATINPLMYRSYYIDVETGYHFYYLNSRYYLADLGRFISADGEISGIGEDILGYNVFAYCQNNPVNMSDADGNWPKWLETTVNAVKNFVYKTISHIKSVASSLDNILLSKKATNRPDSGLIGESDEEIQRKARDKSLSGKERNRYREEEKVRGLRNKQKRQKHMVSEQIGKTVFGMAIVTVAAVGITYVAVNNVTGVGVLDDALIVPLVSMLKQGTILIYQTG